jgi:HAD superfamily hydrolase (TIGR01549 family)
MLARPDAVLFDFGGTLIDDHFDVEAGEERMVELAGGGVDPAEYKRLARELSLDLRKRRLHSQLEHSSAKFTRLIGDHLGISYAQTDAELDWEFWKASERCELVAGAEVVVGSLFSAGVRLAIISNLTFPATVIERELERFGLKHMFAAIVTSDDYGIRKPHPAIFSAVAGRLGVPPSRCWYVGNWAESDVVGAQAAGMTGVWLNRHEDICPKRVKPDAELRGWDGFAGLWDEVTTSS